MLLAAVAWTLAGLPSVGGAWGEPDWVETRPQDAAYYIGIGVAAREGPRAEYREKARLAALRDLASEITVTIDSTFLLRVTETTGLTEEEVRDETRASVQATLTDVEFVDAYKGRREQWVYYRLSRQAYQAQRARARVRALADAEAALAGVSSPTARLRAHLQALAHLLPFVGEAEPKQWTGKSVLSAVDASHRSLVDLLTSIELRPDRSVLFGLSGARVPDPLVVTVFDRNSDGPLGGMPVRFTRSETNAVPTSAHSDSAGRAVFHVGAVGSPAQPLMVHAALDIERLAPEQVPAGFFTTLVERLPVSRVAVPLKLFDTADRESYLWHRAVSGHTVRVLAAYRVGEAAHEWFKMRDEMATHVQKHGAKLGTTALAPGRIAALPIDAGEAWRSLGDVGDAIIMLAVADGRLNRRDTAAGEAVAFSGTIRTTTLQDGQVLFTDTYQGASGFNPMGEAMCMDVLGLHAIKRWRTRYLKQLGGGE
jgi:hypothetical protein